MAGTSGVTPTLSSDQNNQLGQLQDTFTNAQQFALEVTKIQTLGNAKVDAAKSRPQNG
jgi:hypothetical protein